MKVDNQYFILEINNIIRNFENLKSLTFSKNFKKLVFSAEKTIKKRGKIIFFGNGGSAADAQHLAAEMVVRFNKKNPTAKPAISISTDTSIITAIANDYSFDKIFSRQIDAIGNPNDIILAITTSGNSKNIIEALKMAKRKKITSFCFSGNNGGKSKKYADYSIIFPSNKTEHIQIMQIFLGQILCKILEKKFI